MTPILPNTPSTLDHWRRLTADVAALNDPTVRVGMPGGVFGSSVDPGAATIVEPVGTHVEPVVLAGEWAYRVVHWFTPPKSTAPIPGFMRIGNLYRWTHARTPWTIANDLAPLATAVLCARAVYPTRIGRFTLAGHTYNFDADAAFDGHGRVAVHGVSLPDGPYTVGTFNLPWWRVYLALNSDPGAEWQPTCLRCGHEACPGVWWCDTTVSDGADTELCCRGECAYTVGQMAEQDAERKAEDDAEGAE